MFRKAISYDIDVIFYFDGYDNKYVAKGGSLAWRLNNPGLIHSHSGVAIKNDSIGTFQRYAIFPAPSLGERALVEWLYFKKYYNSNLLAIAKHYQPENPEPFLKKLCE